MDPPQTLEQALARIEHLERRVDALARRIWSTSPLRTMLHQPARLARTPNTLTRWNETAPPPSSR